MIGRGGASPSLVLRLLSKGCVKVTAQSRDARPFHSGPRLSRAPT